MDFQTVLLDDDDDDDDDWWNYGVEGEDDVLDDDYDDNIGYYYPN